MMAEKGLDGKYWWELLDWSMMKKTYYMANESLRKKIDESGYWSLGKGVFDEFAC